jgi:hypothetical protein
MRALVFIVLAACGTEPVAGPITGFITEDQTWSGDRTVEDFVTIDRGVTVTVEAGTRLRVLTAAQIEVAGTLLFEGTAEQPIDIASELDGEYWLGMTIAGELQMRYVDQRNGGVSTIAPDAKLTIEDSRLSSAIGDLIVVDGGSVDISYSDIGIAEGDHTHCNLHVNSVQSLRFSHNNNVGVAFGLMLYGGQGDFSHNNWMNNLVDIEPQPGGTGSFDDSFFARGLPAGVPGSTFENPASSPLADCGRR